MADARRQSAEEFRTHFDNVDAQMKGALDKNWKIFGRVISRQSLIVLARDLDDLRRKTAPLTAVDGYDPTLAATLAQSERQYLQSLETNAAELEKAQGAQWLQSVRQEFGELISARIQIMALDEQASATGNSFERGIENLLTRVRTESLKAAAQSATPDNESRPIERSDSRAVARPEPNVVVQATTPGAAPAPTITTTRTLSETAGQPPNAALRRLMAFISAAVLLTLLAICVTTVRSIVVPIRQFMATIRRLAAGESDARFSRGGIEELDTLAVAFNDMAEQLSAAHAVAKEYQTQLEVRVDERTRQLQYLAEHDPLTGLPNRRQLLTYLSAAIKTAPASSQVAVFFLDLDNFKNINDSMGHAFGDLVLKGISHRLREATGGPGGFASRLGGDEFTVIYETPAGMADISRVGTELVSAFQRPMLVEGRELLVSISVGASVYPDHANTPDALLRAADAALFSAKTSGRSRMSLFNHELLEMASLKFRTEQGLRRAVDRAEFELLFQPEVSYETFGTKLVEALLRWRLPDGRHVSPAEFLEVAEETGLITNINDWVLRSAVQSCAKWHHGVWPEARVAVNVSARQLLDSRIVERVQSLLTEYRLPARCIEIELTENVLQTGPATIETLRQLREVGVSIALDDFGTGYSSLASIELLPLTRVKLDRSLIASIDTSSRSLAITRAIVGLCENLDLDVTAEGIERPGQLALLLAHRTLSLQGYLISQPLNADAVPEAVASMPERMQSLLLMTPAQGHAVVDSGMAVRAVG